MKRSGSVQTGFTLIELIIVIIVLGILAVTGAPKFVSLSDDAQISMLKITASAFKSSVDLARHKLHLSGRTGVAENLQVFGNDSSGLLDFNNQGWPSQHWLGADESNPTTDNEDDCLSLWNTMMETSLEVYKASSPTADNGDFKVEYANTLATLNRCNFILVENQRLSFEYNFLTGAVSVDDDLSS